MSDCDDENIFSTMCRLCLSQNVVLISLHADDVNHVKSSTSVILEIVEQFTTVKIDPFDHLPQKICESCIQMLNSMLAFQSKCKQSDEQLHSWKESQDEQKIKVEIAATEEITDDAAVSLEPDDETANENSMGHVQHIVVDTNETSKSAPPRGQRKLACHICGKLYQSYALQFHINKHNGLRPYACDVANCTSTFIAPNDLKQHKVLCHVLKPKLCCDVCGRGFKRKCALDTHRSYHFDPEIPCKVCDKKLRNMRALNKHMLVHSQERKFKCEICAKSFQTRYTLRIHKRVHTQEKPYSCHCGVSFAYKCLLKAHNEKYHKMTDCSTSKLQNTFG